MRNETAGGPAAYDRQLQARRQQYLERVLDSFGRLEPEMKPLDGRLWSLNHARLVTGTDLEKANHYFSGIALTRDPDFMGIRLLKTLLDFRDSPRLSDGARQHLTSIIAGWEMNRFSRVARWPRMHTENHDLMCLTIGLFSEMLRGEDIEGHSGELRQSLAWRFERGFYEWSSHRYQLHYTNPLQVLATHAPADDLREGAEALLNVVLAERALLSVGGHLGGAFMRGYDSERGCDYLDDNRYDAFLPTMWMAFGVAEPRFNYERADGVEPAGEGYGNGSDPRLNQDEAMFFATNELVPHPVVRALLAESAARPELIYTGKRATAGYPQIRAAPSDWRTNQLVYYYNTPHVSMGSVQYVAGAYPITSKAPSRYWSILFPAEPSQVLRTRWADEWASRVVQHRNWLLADGELSESHGLGAGTVGPWNLYRVGKGLCAHIEIAGWHVFQVSDTEKHASAQAFVSALSVPVRDGRHIRGVTTDGERITVDLRTMAVEIDGRARPPFTDMLHDSAPMRSEYGSGVITIDTDAGSLTIDSRKILRLPGSEASQADAVPESLPQLALPARLLWGNPLAGGAETTVDHVRALGGISPDHDGPTLRSVSIFIPRKPSGRMRLAVYAGGTLDGGPHAGIPAKLLYDFGATDEARRGWVTLEHPGDGVALPPNAPLWVAWKGTGGRVSVLYQEELSPGGGFQRARGRWESKAVSPAEGVPWPDTWPAVDEGSFEDYWYSCCLSYGQD